jgi:hypothetical protein
MDSAEDVEAKKQKRVAKAMFNEPVSLKFIFETIGVIFIFIAISIFLVKSRTKEMD